MQIEILRVKSNIAEEFINAPKTPAHYPLYNGYLQDKRRDLRSCKTVQNIFLLKQFKRKIFCPATQVDCNKLKIVFLSEEIAQFIVTI